jgi:hypothetical protein
MAMADAHPDRGGTDEGFIAARKAYERALRGVSWAPELPRSRQSARPAGTWPLTSNGSAGTTACPSVTCQPASANTAALSCRRSCTARPRADAGSTPTT